MRDAAILLVETETLSSTFRSVDAALKAVPVALSSWRLGRGSVAAPSSHCGAIMRTSRRLRRLCSMQPVVPCLTWSLSLGRIRRGSGAPFGQGALS